MTEDEMKEEIRALREKIETEKKASLTSNCLIGCIMIFFYILLGGVITYIMIRLGWIS